MCLRSVTCSGPVFVAFLVFYCNVMATSATNVAQLKNQQQALGHTVTTSTQHQHLPNHHGASPAQSAQQLQQQNLPSVVMTAHPANGISSSTNTILLDSNKAQESEDLSSTFSSTSAYASLHSPQYVVHDKEIAMQEVLKHFNADSSLGDPYQALNEFQREPHDNINYQQPPPPPLVSFHSKNTASPWNLYEKTYSSMPYPLTRTTDLMSHNFNPFDTFQTSLPVSPRFFPIMNYRTSFYVPFPFIVSPDIFYPTYSNLPQMANEYEDSMSRGAGSSRRPVSSQHGSSFPRNSPIYYMRLPPTPYMFLPNLGIGPSTTSIGAYPNMLPYQPLPSVPSFSSIFNVPINFLANGKPSNIYQMSAAPNDVQNPIQFSNVASNYNTRPPPPPHPSLNTYRPAASSHTYFSSPPSSNSPSSNYVSYPGAMSQASSALLHHDSKLIALKRPYVFNGRPEDIYILPNNFNPLYSSENTYY